LPINPKIAALNAANARFCASTPKCRFLDTAPVLAAHLPESPDGAHPAAGAYMAWRELIQRELAAQGLT
jgi:lysophospholipase L1-like esterase